MGEWGTVTVMLDQIADAESTWTSRTNQIAALKKKVPRRVRKLSLRLAVILVALAVLYLRTPSTFTNPQFWGEDAVFFSDAYSMGLSALVTPVAGYLCTAQHLVALLASHFSPVIAPAFYNYAAVLLTLIVVWIITSPRLDMPYRPLLALAVVIVPMGQEELGTITNIQWILPIGAFTLLFMSVSRSQIVLVSETIFLGLTAVSGPFSIFLTPLFLWRLVSAPNPNERQRFAILSTVVGFGALTQILFIVRFGGLNPYGGEHTPFSWSLWVTVPFSRLMKTFPPALMPIDDPFKGSSGAILGLTLFVIAAALALRTPYRTQKIFMLLFSLLITTSSMYKQREVLDTLVNTQRYFYAASIFCLWFICCISSQRYVRGFLAGIVCFTELMLLTVIADTPLITEDLRWRAWANYISSGLPVNIPVSPAGWVLQVPATPDGPLSEFAPWLGEQITKKKESKIDQSACLGVSGVMAGEAVRTGFIAIDPRPFEARTAHDGGGENALWRAFGSARDASSDRPVRLVVLVDDAS